MCENNEVCANTLHRTMYTYPSKWPKMDSWAERNGLNWKRFKVLDWNNVERASRGKAHEINLQGQLNH